MRVPGWLQDRALIQEKGGPQAGWGLQFLAPIRAMPPLPEKCEFANRIDQALIANEE